MGQLIFETVLNGLQFGIFLFLVAAGLTLVLGIMNFVNLAHGSMFMMGAYVAAWIFEQSGNFLLAAVVALPVILLLGIVIEYLAFRTIYARDHLDQVLATFGCILFFNQMVLVVFGAESQEFKLPASINFPFPLFGFTYPFYRLIVIIAGILVAVGLYLAITRTRVGMRIRAGSSNRAMIGALGVNVTALYTIVFGIGAALAGFAGIMIGPIESVESQMGEEKLILAIVVIVIGGIGSIRGAFIAAIFVGLVEISGRVFMTDILRAILEEEFAQTAGPALASMMIYILMAAILFFKPEGLFPARTG
ncbi:MAG: branched-chain amino acid ABC transporter permease [Rhodospirillaceae bacterium]|nr:branched-chain amino acid ABC transporter permease [Rhodospirillaceae bacterium]